MVLAIHGAMPVGIKIIGVIVLIAMGYGVYYAISKVYISSRDRVKKLSEKADEEIGRKYLFVSSTIRILFSLFLLYILFSFSLQLIFSLLQ